MHWPKLILTGILLLAASLLSGQTVGGMHIGMTVGTGITQPPPPAPAGGFNPTTTLATESGNNSSAASSRTRYDDLRSGISTIDYEPNSLFPSDTTANVSKVSIKNLLYAGATTKVYAEVMTWFLDNDLNIWPSYPNECTQAAATTWGPTRYKAIDEGGHYCTGYSSQNATQIHAQINDMISRGFDGMIITWEGPCRLSGCRNNATTWAGGYRTSDLAVQAIKADLEARCSGTCPFTFALMPDASHLSSSFGWTLGAKFSFDITGSTSQSNFETRVKDDLCYANKFYFSSPAYLAISGMPVFMPFWPDQGSSFATTAGTDMSTFGKALSTNCPSFHSAYAGATNNGAVAWYWGTGSGYDTKWGMTTSFASGPINGGFGWENLSSTRGVQGQTTNMTSADSSAQSFYTKAKTHNIDGFFGAVWPGFDDQLADWSPSCSDASCTSSSCTATYPGGCGVYSGRITDRVCGVAWLNSFTQINNAYSNVSQLNHLGVVTWNDWDEGTEIEAGIDNCYTITSPAVVGGNFNWTMSTSSGAASTATIDHFTLYLGDGAGNLAVLQDNISNSATTVAIPTNSIPAGTWSLSVKMVGVNSIINRMSAPVAFTK